MLLQLRVRTLRSDPDPDAHADAYSDRHADSDPDADLIGGPPNCDECGGRWATADFDLAGAGSAMDEKEVDESNRIGSGASLGPIVLG